MSTRKINVDFSLEMAPDGITVSAESVTNFIKGWKVIEFNEGHVMIHAYLVNGYMMSETVHGVFDPKVAEAFARGKIRDKVFELLTFLLSFNPPIRAMAPSGEDEKTEEKTVEKVETPPPVPEKTPPPVESATATVYQGPPLKLIIAGGRDYQMTTADIARLDPLPIEEIITGGAKGVDATGKWYAGQRAVSHKEFIADWEKHDKAAGPLRNREMAEYADAVALFTGGKGTQSMHDEAMKAGILIFDFR